MVLELFGLEGDGVVRDGLVGVVGGWGDVVVFLIGIIFG